MKKLRNKIVMVVMALWVGIVAPGSAWAKISEDELFFYAENGIYFFDQYGNVCSTSAAVGSFDGQGSAGLSDLQASFVDAYHAIAEKLSIEYGIPWETVIAQGILESAAGTSAYARERNNFFGIGAFDSNPDHAYYYATPEEGWRGYYENIRVTATYREHGVFSGDTITDPYAYARAIKEAGYATDPDYVAKVSQLVSAVENRAKQNNWLSSSELASKYPEMLRNAAKNASGGSSGSGSSGDSGGSGSTCYAPSSGNGDINATAINLSWPNRDHAPTDPKPEYREALNMSNGVGTLGEGDECSIGGYSCDAFLATVMRYSGVDESFPCCGAANQLDYLLRNQSIYEEITNTGNTSNLQPGDIRASSGHVEIVVQLENGSYKIASASHCDRTADHWRDYYASSKFRIFRWRGNVRQS